MGFLQLSHSEGSQNLFKDSSGKCHNNWGEIGQLFDNPEDTHLFLYLMH